MQRKSKVPMILGIISILGGLSWLLTYEGIRIFPYDIRIPGSDLQVEGILYWALVALPFILLIALIILWFKKRHNPALKSKWNVLSFVLLIPMMLVASFWGFLMIALTPG